jgi:hypothetical protein
MNALFIMKHRKGEDIVPSGVHVRDCEGMLSIEKVKDFLKELLMIF